MLSQRTAVGRAPNALTLALEQERARRGDAGREPLLDLTVSNPTTAGLPYDREAILSAFANASSLTYRPEPFGMRAAREAVARVYAESGVTVDPSRIVLTASTSEAYGFLFKLLCDPGDEALVPAPSYPLFDLLARFEGVALKPYRLAYDGQWHIERSSVEAAITAKTRAILTVGPNNPTGSYLKRGELDALGETGLPIVSDEVFAPFPLAPAPGSTGSTGSPGSPPRARRVTSVLEGGPAPLVFALSGLSKMAALPQMKVGWIAVGGADGARVEEALARLELLGDAYLSVGTPAQLALPSLLAGRHAVAGAIAARLASNLATIRRVVSGTATTLLDLEGGWYATLRLPRTRSEEQWALLFLEEDGVYVHPGHFFDFADEAFVVVSLLTPEPALAEGVRRLVARVES